ncbi:MAG TPA: preprotein translocase subunit Sec61beta [archaeon]|nr:preprotein translocase subunit Sec61beta [archaeon]
MAKQKISLPSSMGGIMRYDEEVGGIKLAPGQVIILTLVVCGIILLLQLLK